MSSQILSISGLQKYYGAKLILDDINLILNRGDRAVLVGENGAGKSTLARLILGQEESDRGDIRLASPIQLGYLPQEVQVDADISVAQYIERGLGELNRLRQRLSQLEEQLAQDEDIDAALEEYGRVQQLFEARGGYTLENRLERVFAGLNLHHLEQGRSMISLSGGEKTRVGLAALLLQNPDLLILDEPTNHLDFAGIAWLEEYLQDYPHTLLMITHDRQFINRLAQQILDLSAVSHSITTYYGNYDEYLAQREAQYQAEVEAYHSQTNRIKELRSQMKREAHSPRKAKRPDDGDKYIKFGGQQSSQRTSGKLIRSARQQINQLEANRLENPRHVWHIEFAFDPVPLPSMEPLRLQSLRMDIGERQLMTRADAVLRKGERIALVAPNGSGKTSLLRLIIGELQATAGEIKLSPGALPGYLDQTGQSFDERRNIVDLLAEISSDSADNLLSLLHRSGLFRDAHLAGKSVADLSLGQRRKLGLACLIHSRANLLLLDEPSNHLDLISLEALERSLLQFPGALLAATHDRWFIDKIATGIWHLRDGELIVE